MLKASRLRNAPDSGIAGQLHRSDSRAGHVSASLVASLPGCLVACVRGHRPRRAFTLIELVVTAVTGVILLLILIPSLGQVKEQARVQTCLSNLRTIGQAANAYLIEYADLPFAVHNDYQAGGQTYDWTVHTEFIWGGGRPDKSEEDWDETGWGGSWPPTIGDICHLPPRHRPLNRFLDSGVSWDNPQRDTEYQRLNIAMKLPACLKCPSDAFPLGPWAQNPNPGISDEMPFHTWEFWGTSYPINWYWPYYYQGAPPGNGPPYNGSFLGIVGGKSPVPGLGKHMLKDKGGRWGSRFALFYENRAHDLLAGAMPRGVGNPSTIRLSGWHKQIGRHAVAFRDGSARYMYLDTNHHNGPGWTVWPNHPWEGNWAPYDELNP